MHRHKKALGYREKEMLQWTCLQIAHKFEKFVVKKKMYESSRSAVLLEGEKSEMFDVEQGVAQGCSLSLILCSLMVCW